MPEVEYRRRFRTKSCNYVMRRFGCPSRVPAVGEMYMFDPEIADSPCCEPLINDFTARVEQVIHRDDSRATIVYLRDVNHRERTGSFVRDVIRMHKAIQNGDPFDCSQPNGTPRHIPPRWELWYVESQAKFKTDPRGRYVEFDYTLAERAMFDHPILWMGKLPS